MTTRKKVYMRSLCLLLALLVAVTAGLVHNHLYGSAEDSIGASAEGRLMIEENSGEQDRDGNASPELGQSGDEREEAPALGESEGNEEIPDEPVLPEEPTLGLSIMPMSMIVDPFDPSVVTVDTFADLKAAIEGNNGYTYIKLGADIEQPTGAIAANSIVIPATKASLTIDGANPSGGVYTYTQGKMTDRLYSFSLPNANRITKEVVVKNLNVDGYNWYGIVGAEFVVAFNDFTITYDNITYDGPQPVYSAFGRTVVKDSSFVVRGAVDFNAGNTSYSSKPGAGETDEFAESGSITLEGDIDIKHLNNGGNATFWLKGNPNGSFLKVAAGSNISIYTSFTSTFFFDYTPDIDLIIEDNATISLTSGRGWWNYTGRFNNVTIGDGASLVLNSTTTSVDTRNYIFRNMEVQPGGSFEYYMNSTGGPFFQPFNASSTLTVNDPERFILSNIANVSPYRNGAAGTTVSFKAGAVNYWNTTRLDNNIDTMPTHIWNKPMGGGVVEMSGSVSGTASPAWSTLSHNLALSDDPIDDLPSASNFSFSSMRSLVMGRQALDPDELDYAASGNITGTTDASAQLKGYYTKDSTTYTGYGTADGSGGFDFTVSPDPGMNVDVTVLSLSDYLRTRQLTRVETVLAIIHVPTALNYGTQDIPVMTTAYDRIPNAASDQYIEVLDTRGGTSKWSLRASATPLVSSSGVAPAIDGAVIYNNGTTDIALGSAETTLYDGTTSLTPYVYTWGSAQGLYLKVPGNTAYPGHSYETTVTWSLYDVP